MQQRPIYRFFDTVVRRVEDVTPRMRRITLYGESLAGFASDRPGQWVKLFFDRSDAGRAFTIRRWRPDKCELDIDFVRHEGGLAGSWIAEAKRGAAVRLAGPRSHFRHNPTRKLFLFGDETAIPAISAIVEGLAPHACATAVIEIEQDNARQEIVTRAQVDWSWIVAQAGRPGCNLTAVVRSLAISPDDAQIWLACESEAAREMRLAFTRMGFAKSMLHASGYWKKGTIEHVDRDSDY